MAGKFRVIPIQEFENGSLLKNVDWETSNSGNSMIAGVSGV